MLSVTFSPAVSALLNEIAHWNPMSAPIASTSVMSKERSKSGETSRPVLEKLIASPFLIVPASRITGGVVPGRVCAFPSDFVKLMNPKRAPTPK